MEDRELMEKELLVIKGVCDLYLHGAIESSTKEVHEAFQCALEESLNIQNKIYNLMAEKGWYKMEMAEQTKPSNAKIFKYELNKNRIITSEPKLLDKKSLTIWVHFY